MSRNKKIAPNVLVIILIGLVVILLISLWQNHRSMAYEAVLERNIFLLNENLMQYQNLGKKTTGKGDEAVDYLRWKYLLKEQVDQTAQIFSDKAAALKSAGKDTALASLLYYNLGLTQVMNSNFPAAIEAFEEAVKLDPKNGYGYYNLGMLYYAHLKDKAKALHCYKRYMEVFPHGIYSGVVRGRIDQLEEAGS